VLYLASPYTHRRALIREQRYQIAVLETGRLMRAGHIIYSPIVHSHPIAVTCGLPDDWGYWRRVNSDILRRAAGLLVLGLEGWERSTGIEGEIAIAQHLGLPVAVIAVGDDPPEEFVAAAYPETHPELCAP
jgi:hypothetical protein